MKDIANFQSEYLHVGRKNENWHFRDIKISESGLTSLVDISSPYISKHDKKGFHLSIFTAQEACAELLIYWVCLKAGLERKPGEAWVKEFSSKFFKPIRDFEGVRIHLNVKKSRLGVNLLVAVGSFEVVGPNGGLFTVELKGMIENYVD
uniref:hypothetical protein n=1 Tax=Synechococcus sp. UW106 TaxID=368495 RepID=UPI0010BDDE4E|nr:hypothetical protein [Synechococcus sp. UW106]